VAAAVVHDEPAHELCLGRDAVLHLHHLDHVQINGAPVLVRRIWA
jgi:hypothetical protein